MPYICRNCTNTGLDMFGNPCPCAAGRELAGSVNDAKGGTWPIAKQWPDVAVAQMDGRWFRLAHVGGGRYEVVDGPFGTHQQALLSGREA